MATIRQKKLAKALVENLQVDKPLNAGELLETVGYAKSVAEGKPGEILEQKGVQEELIKFGFDPAKAKEVVAEILVGGESDVVKLKAADMIFKVHGSYAAEKHVNLNVNRKLDDEELKKTADELLRLQRENTSGT